MIVSVLDPNEATRSIGRMFLANNATLSPKNVGSTSFPSMYGPVLQYSDGGISLFQPKR